MNSKLWMFLCLLFFAYNLVLLFDDYYAFNFMIVEKGDKLYDNATLYQVCSEFKYFKKNIEEGFKKRYDVTINTTNESVNVRSFLNYSIGIIENRLRTTRLFRLDQGYIFKIFVCFEIDKEFYDKHPFAKDFLKIFSVQLFVHSRGKRPFFFEYVHNNYKNNVALILKIQKIYDRNYLESSNCKTHKDQFLSSRFACIKKCRPEKPIQFNWHRNLLELNWHDDPALFKLDLIIDKEIFRYKREAKSFQDVKQSTKRNFHTVEHLKDYRKCMKKCPDNDCFVETYNTVTVPADNEFGNIDIETTIYTAYYSTSYFWLQFFGLLTLFTSTSVTYTFSRWTSLAVKRLRPSYQVYFHQLLPKIKLLMIIISFLSILAQSYIMFSNYNFEKNYPNKTIISEFSAEPFSVTICLPIEVLVNNESTIVKGRNSQILQNFTFAELESKTNEIGKGVEEISLLHRNEIKKLNWVVTRKVAFKGSSFGHQSCLSRCFRIEIDFDDLKYRNSMPFYFLNIKFRTHFREVFLMENEQSLTSGLIDFKGDFFVKKMINRKSTESRKSNCTNLEREGCSSIQHCMDR